MNPVTTYLVNNTIVFDERVRNWCKFPYPDHPKGCPNYGAIDRCPPQAPMVFDFIDMNMPIFFAVITFDLKTHMERMIDIHPDWSGKQARCILYWQNGVRKQLGQACNTFISNKLLIYDLCPEAMGVNVFRTLHRIGIPIKKNPTETVYKVAIIGSPTNITRRQTQLNLGEK